MHRFGCRHSDNTIDVTFSAREADASIEVMLDIDFLLHPAWPSVDHLVLRPLRDGVEREVTVRLPADLEASYRFVRRSRGEADPAAGLDALRELVESGEADPDYPVFLSDAFGSGTTASRLVGPDAAPGHPVWAPGEQPEVALIRRHIALGDRTVTLLVPDTAQAVRRLVLMLDGDVWLDSLGIETAAARWNHGRAEPAAFAIIPTPDREMLAERDAIAALVVERVMPAVCGALGAQVAAEHVAIVGQSYGGLAAAGIVADRPACVGTAVVSSGSFWFVQGYDARDEADPGQLTRDLREASLPHSLFLLHVGREEGGMIDQSRMFADAALAAGASVTLETRPGGHDYAWYRHAVFDALEQW